jgi:tetratricopeptide (TPR) repeat protein
MMVFKQFCRAGAWVVAFSVVAAPVWAQTGTARGKVVDDKGQAITDAAVTLEYKGGVTRKLDTKSNKKGEYTQVGLQPGVYRITASKDGYQPAFIESRVGVGEPTVLPDIKLTARAAGAAAAGDKGGDELRASFQKAVELTQAGKWDEAEAAYKEMLVKSPTVPELHFNLGFVYAKKKDTAAAEASFLKAIELKPDYAEAYAALSEHYQSSGKADKAGPLLTKAVADNPKDGRLQYAIGIYHVNGGRTEEAQAAFQKAAELDPGNPEVYFHLGTLAVGQNKVNEAVAHLEKYLSMKPQNAQNVGTAQALLAALKPKK